jgi:Domain of unknown function (DUF4439)
MTTSEVAALQRALAAEHVAVYAYGAAGARVAERHGAQARDGRDAHSAARDALEAAVRALGADPVVAAAAYALDPRPTSRAAALRLLVAVEETASAAYAGVLAATDDRALRRLAVTALGDTAGRATAWRLVAGDDPATDALPGIAT